ncbi:uncharacterized protein LOC131144420 [Malania oleifera]|uniref:uncharacterized protein LOC131144420 n=1 Tax=Malania oleifera TaxID=397392 RepID=UPI0025ADFEEC|nr:uncharacterized protein LOC131144420 [Malania oleifera]
MAYRGSTFQQFTQANRPTFVGRPNSIAAEDWIQEIEELPGVLECIEEQKVKYFPVVTRAAKVDKFLQLTQEPMTVQQYAAKFVKLSRFAPHMVSSKPLKARMFERGLRQSICAQVVALLTQSFYVLAGRAMTVEASIQEGESVVNQKKRPLPQGFQTNTSEGSYKRLDNFSGQRQEMGYRGHQGGSQCHICSRCHQRHWG